MLLKRHLSTKEVKAKVGRIKARDDERDVHVGDLLHVVCTRPEGFDLVHESDVQKNLTGTPGPRKHKRRVYKVLLSEIY